MLIFSEKADQAPSLPDSTLFRLAFNAGVSKVFSEPDSAAYFFDEADRIANRLNDAVKRGWILNQRGRILYIKGNYDAALNTWIKTDSIYQQTGFLEGRKNTLNNIGLIYAAWEESAVALRYYRQARKIALSLADTTMIFNTAYNMGIAWQNAGFPDSAQNSYSSIISSSKLPDFRLQKARAYMMRAESKVSSGDFEAGLNDGLQAKSLFLPTETWDWGFLMGVLSRAYEGLGKHELAIASAKEGIALQKRINAKWELSRLNLILGQAYEKQGDISKSLEHLKLHIAYKDSVFTDREKRDLFRRELSRKELEATQLALENEQKSQQLRSQQFLVAGLIFLVSSAIIGLIFLHLSNRTKQEFNARLEDSNAKLSATNAELTKLNAFKNELLSIVGHDMANMMTSLTGFMELFTAKKLNKEDFEQVAPMLEDNLLRLHLTFNNLFRWAESQLAGFHQQKEMQSASVVFPDIVRIFEPAARSRDIALFVKIESDTAFSFDPNHLNLILRNLIHNAIKFTRTGGKIIVYSIRRNDKLIIGVQDNGIGISEAFRTDILSTTKRMSKVGTRREAGTGLGLQTSKKLLALNNSALQIESDGKTGSNFFFEVM